MDQAGFTTSYTCIVHTKKKKKKKVSALDLGCSNHNPTQATSGNPIATSECWDYWVNGQLLHKNGLSELSSHRFWLFMVSALDLGCSNYNPTQATSGNQIATSECWDYWVNGQLLGKNGLSELSSHRFWLFMVSALDLGCSNHNPTQATSGNPIAT